MTKILRASSAGYPCDRYIWYSVNGVKGSKVSEHTQRVFDTGTCLEPFVVDCLRKTGWDVIYNPGSQNAGIELTYELQNGTLAGHYDCFISKGEMQYVLADIKTMNDRAFMRWRQEGTKKNQPKYYTQLHVYAGAAIKAGYTVKKLAIVGFNKNNSEIYIDIFDYDPAYFTKICKHTEAIMSSDEKPSMNSPTTEWACSYCKFKEICELCRDRRDLADPIEGVLQTTDGEIISAMDLLLAAREYQHAGNAMEKEAKSILDAKVFQKGIRNIQGGHYSLQITEKPRTSFDTKAFKESHPELVSQFMKTSTSTYFEVEADFDSN